MAKTIKDRTTRKQKNNSNNSLRNIIPSDLLVNTITNRIDLVSTVHNMTSTLIDEYVKKNVWKNLENLIDSKISKVYEDQKEEKEQEDRIISVMNRQNNLNKIKELRLSRQKSKSSFASWTLEEKQKIILSVQSCKHRLDAHRLKIMEILETLEAEKWTNDDIEKYLNELLTKKEKEKISEDRSTINNNTNVINDIKPEAQQKESKSSFLSGLKSLSNNDTNTLLATAMAAAGPWALAAPFLWWVVKFGVKKFIGYFKYLTKLPGLLKELKIGAKISGIYKAMNEKFLHWGRKFSIEMFHLRNTVFEKIGKMGTALKNFGTKLNTQMKEFGSKALNSIKTKFGAITASVAGTLSKFKTEITETVKSVISKWETKLSTKPNATSKNAASQMDELLDDIDKKGGNKPPNNAKINKPSISNTPKAKFPNLDVVNPSKPSAKFQLAKTNWSSKNATMWEKAAKAFGIISKNPILKQIFITKASIKLGATFVAKFIAKLATAVSTGPLGVIFLLWTIHDVAMAFEDLYQAAVETLDENSAATEGDINIPEWDREVGTGISNLKVEKLESWGSFAEQNQNNDMSFTLASHLKDTYDITKDTKDNSTQDLLKDAKPIVFDEDDSAWKWNGFSIF